MTTATRGYSYLVAYNRKRGMWEVVVRVPGNVEPMTCAYYQQPTDEDAERIAARLYGLRMHRCSRMDVSDD